MSTKHREQPGSRKLLFFFYFSMPVWVTYFLQVAKPPEKSPNSFSNWEPSVQICEPVGTFLCRLPWHHTAISDKQSPYSTLSCLHKHAIPLWSSIRGSTYCLSTYLLTCSSPLSPYCGNVSYRNKSRKDLFQIMALEHANVKNIIEFMARGMCASRSKNRIKQGQVLDLKACPSAQHSPARPPCFKGFITSQDSTPR